MTDYVGWTDERVEKLKKLYTEGHSNATIARMIGGITRNAVIGKAARMGLGGNRRTKRESKELRQRLSAVQRRTVAKREARKPTPVQSLFRDNMRSEPLPPIDTLEPTLSWDELEQSSKNITQCRAMPGDHLSTTDKVFCGRAVVVGTSYCECHARRYLSPIVAKQNGGGTMSFKGVIGNIIKSDLGKLYAAEEFTTP